MYQIIHNELGALTGIFLGLAFFDKSFEEGKHKPMEFASQEQAEVCMASWLNGKEECEIRRKQ